MTNNIQQLTPSASNSIFFDPRNFRDSLDVNTITPRKPQSSITRQNLVIIDSRVEDWHILAAGAKDDGQVIILDRRQDSIEQIDSIIKQYSHIDSLHLISHGTPGSLQLGHRELSVENIEGYSDILKSWSRYLIGTSLLIYGCRVAHGNRGKLFLQRLHNLTKANIAASSDKVGNILKGGNWSLDYHIGQVNQELAFLPEVTQSYPGTFEPVVSLSTSPDTLVETEGTVFTFSFALSEPPPPEGIEVTVFGNVAESLNQLDLFGITTEGIDSFAPADLINTGFIANIVEQTATLSAPIFPDNDEDAIVTEPGFQNDDITVTYALIDGEGYSVDPNQN